MRYQRSGALRQLKIGNRWLSLWWTPRDFRLLSWECDITPPESGSTLQRYDGRDDGD